MTGAGKWDILNITKPKGGGCPIEKLYTAAKALWNEAFAGEDPAFTEALFALGFPTHFRAICEDGAPVCMLFALPYPLMTEQGPVEARYLYAVATAKAHRGKGYAKHLLREVMAEGVPVFLRPMSPSLFDFYKRAGLSPLSPHSELCGVAGGDPTGISALSPEEYLALRDTYLKPPYCRMTPAFLALAYLGGGAIARKGQFAALYERRGDKILFKEWWGDPAFAPDATAYLGAREFCLRRADPAGTPFGMGHGLAPETVFLTALD